MIKIDKRYIDKNHSVEYATIKGMSIEMEYSEPQICRCKFDGAYYDSDAPHTPECEVNTLCKELGIPAKGVTAIICNTNSGDYTNVFVYYGSDPYRKSARWFPVIIPMEPMQKVIELKHIARSAMQSTASIGVEHVGTRTYEIYSEIYVCDEQGYGEYFDFTARLCWPTSDYIPSLTWVKVTANHDRSQHAEVKEAATEAIMSAIGEHADRVLKFL